MFEDPFHCLFSLPDTLVIEQIRKQDGTVIVSLRLRQKQGRCPLCGQESRRVHSLYWRHVADLPCVGQAVQVRLQTVRFRCAQLDCPRQTFTLIYPSFLKRYSRRTQRSPPISDIWPSRWVDEPGAVSLIPNRPL